MTTNFEDTIMNSKFRGCILGCLLGDCYGEPFEFRNRLSSDQTTVQTFFDDVEGNKLEDNILPYTDDTVMTLNIVKTLIKGQPIDYKYMAKQFTESYYSEPPVRNYGNGVRTVFSKLRDTNYENIYKPAAEQFDGQGSFGNGGAMRIAPIGLYFHNETESMIDAVRKTTEITHAHLSGVNGAILQCFAVQQALLMDPTVELDTCKFVEDLIEKIKCFEESHKDKNKPPPYQTKLKSVLKFAISQVVPARKEIVEVLGNNVSAFRAVPTAIYCFLRAQSEIPGVECDNIFRRTIQYAMTLGGDTDTIGAMAGAIAGAYYGDGILHENMLSHCERHEEIKEFANKLYLASLKK